MIYIETGSDDVYYNFGLEYYLTVEKKFEDTVFLFWRTTPTLMIGKYQNVLEEIRKPYADAHGIHIVRRMSGGGTIYTDLGGWQFSFIEQNHAEEIEFRHYIAPVIDALREMGVAASFNGRNDLCIDGRKFSGNAQYRQSGATVHHGSLLFDTDIAEMVASTTVDSGKILSKSIKSVRDRVTNISEHLREPMDPLEFKARMVRSILGPGGTVFELGDGDRARAGELAKEKFENWQMIYGQSPRFNIVRSGRFEGGKIEFKIEVAEGMIEEAYVSGDFFATVDASEIENAITGIRYERNEVLEALLAHGIDGAVYRISAAEMAGLIAD